MKKYTLFFLVLVILSPRKLAGQTIEVDYARYLQSQQVDSINVDTLFLRFMPKPEPYITGQPQTIVYRYDVKHRITWVIYQGNEPAIIHYIYDRAGNLSGQYSLPAKFVNNHFWFYFKKQDLEESKLIISSLKRYAGI